MADGRRIKSGIDSSEKDAQILGNDVGDELVVRGEELSFGGLPRGGFQLPVKPHAKVLPDHHVAVHFTAIRLSLPSCHTAGLLLDVLANRNPRSSTNAHGISKRKEY